MHFACTSGNTQVGNECPDVLPAKLKAAWGAVQALIDQGLVSAGHDVSDGGIATTLLEMAFAGTDVAVGASSRGNVGAACMWRCD